MVTRTTSAQRPRLLVVDDDDLVRASICSTIAAAGYDADGASEGDEALRMLDDNAADLVIVDIFMPKKDGLELIREVRRKWPSTRIIAISGGNQAIIHDMLSAARQFGADASLDKPFAPSELLMEVKKLIAPA